MFLSALAFSAVLGFTSALPSPELARFIACSLYYPFPADHYSPLSLSSRVFVSPRYLCVCVEASICLSSRAYVDVCVCVGVCLYTGFICQFPPSPSLSLYLSVSLPPFYFVVVSFFTSICLACLFSFPIRWVCACCSVPLLSFIAGLCACE